MVNTVNIKSQQLEKGYFRTGTGEEIILIIGSCRVAPYANYLEQWNEQNGNRFTICCLDPYNWNYDLKDNRIDMEAKINSLEKYDILLSMFCECDIFIHEYYNNFGMFNTNKDAPKNIYQFGIKPEIDICIPNWNDLFVLVADIVSFDVDIKKKAIADYNVLNKLSPQTITDIYKVRDENILKFYDICGKTSFPEFLGYFKELYESVRFFWNSNHVSKKFTLKIFELIMQKFNINISQEFYNQINEYDMFANNFTYLTEYDEFHWQEERKLLKDLL